MYAGSMNGIASGLLSALPGMQHPYVRKLLGWRQGDEEEKWAEKVSAINIVDFINTLSCVGDRQSGEEVEKTTRRA